MRAPSAPRPVFNEKGPMSNNMPSPPKNVEVEHGDEGAGGSMSPGSDCALISPPAKALKPAAMSRKKLASNTRD